MISAFLWVFSPEKLNSQEIFGTYFEAYPLANLRGVGGDKDLFYQGMEFYNAASYEKAIASFNLIEHKHPRFMESRLYLGNSHLSTKQYLAAIQTLSGVCASQDARFSEAGCWYLLLAYVGAGQKDPFHNLSERILNQAGHAYQEKVREVQKKWEN